MLRKATFLFASLSLSIVCLNANDAAESLKEKLLTPKQKEVYKEKKQLLQESQDKKLTIFYLTSESMGDAASVGFANSVQKLTNKGIEAQGMIVFRGFPNDISGFAHKVAEKSKKATSSVIKVHPFIFKHFNITRVPAYVIAECNDADNFRFKDCENKYIIKGDIALSDVFSRIGDVDKKYKQYYFKLIEPN